MKKLLLIALFAVGCNQAEEFQKLQTPSFISAPTPTENQPSDPIVPSTPTEPTSVLKGVCKIETAPNYEPRQSDGTTIFIPDNSLCQKKVCEKEYTETPFDTIHPSEVTFGCSTLASDKEYSVTLSWHADDSATVWVDGKEIGASTNWRLGNEKTFTLKGGCHTLAIHAIDVYQVTSGVIATLKVDGQTVWRSGDDNKFLKTYGPDKPEGDWTSLNYDESKWKSSSTCNSFADWEPQAKAGLLDLYTEGAKWIWWSADCKTLKQSFFRVSFSLNPPPVPVNDDELCKE